MTSLISEPRSKGTSRTKLAPYDPTPEEVAAVGYESYDHDPNVIYGDLLPRVWTRPLRPLTSETSAGFAMIEFAVVFLGWELTPWQRWFLIHSMELNELGDFRFKTLLLLIARQNGKTFVVKLITLYRMFVDYVELVIGTAQSLAIAEDTWQEVVESAQDTPKLNKHVRQVLNGTGKKQLILNRLRGSPFAKSRYLCRPATKKGTRSLSAELVLLDELREHTDWDGWGAVTPTTAAKKNSQIIAMSNAGDRYSVVLNKLRKNAHGRLDDPDDLYGEDEAPPQPDLTFGIFEWSSDPWRDVNDQVGFQQANPSCGYTELTMSYLLGVAANGDEATTRTEHMCQKVDLMNAPPFGKGIWEAGSQPDSSIAADSKFVYGLDMDKDRRRSIITVAGYREDGGIHVEAVITQPGTGWVKNWLTKPWKNSQGIEQPARQDNPLCLGVALQTASPAASLLSSGEFDDLKIPIHQWGGAEITRGTGMFHDAVKATARFVAEEPVDENELLVWHRPDVVLDKPATSARKKGSVGGGFLWDIQASPVDIAPLNGANAAFWALLNIKQTVKKSAYAELFASLPDDFGDDDDDFY